MRETEQQKVKRKQELADQRKREYEEIMSYNPWGQPAVGAPKVPHAVGQTRDHVACACSCSPAHQERQDQGSAAGGVDS